MQFKVAPTDLTYLWDECPRCFWLKAHKIRTRPRLPMPSIFNKIDYLQREAFKDFVFPNGDRLDTSNRTLTSAPLNNGDDCIVIGGRLDCLIIHPADGLISVMDFKTSEPTEESIVKYNRQLHAYAWALERPAKGELQRVSGLRLFYSTPERYQCSEQMDMFTMMGYIKVHELPYDPDWFGGFLLGVLVMLAAPEPLAGDKCEYCKWEQEIKGNA